MAYPDCALKLGKSCLVVLALATAVSCGADDDDDGDGAVAGAGSGGTGSGSGGKSATSGNAGRGGAQAAGAGGAAGRGGTSGRGGVGGSASGAAAEGGQAGADGQAGAAGASGESGGSGESPVDLGSAEAFVVLAKSAISTVPPSVITGNVGVSPAAASYITGFSLTADASDQFSISPQVTGRIYASDYSSPTPSELTAAIGDMELAFTDAAGRAADVSELGAGDIGGMTLEPGVYAWGTGLLVPTDVTLAGNADAVWIFQIAQDLTVSSATQVTLSGGARAENVFWQVSGSVELGTTSHFEGVVLTATAITLQTGASINGRLFAQTAVNLDANTLSQPGE
jgi:hypothetical protein